MHPCFYGLPPASSHRRAGLLTASVSVRRHCYVETAKCPEPLRPSPVLPSLEGRVPPLGRTLLPRHRSYWLMHQSRLLLLYFGISLVEGVFAGCHQPLLPAGPSRRYPCESFPRCLAPCSGGPKECSCLFLPPRHRPSPSNNGSASRCHPRTRLSTEHVSKLQAFRYVQASGFAHPPDRSYRSGSMSTGQPRFIRPGISCFVTSARTGYASRPNTGNWRRRDFHPARPAALSAAPIAAMLRRPFPALRPF